MLSLTAPLSLRWQSPDRPCAIGPTFRSTRCSFAHSRSSSSSSRLRLYNSHTSSSSSRLILRGGWSTVLSGIRMPQPAGALTALGTQPVLVAVPWTILQNYGPNHLGLRYNALPEHQMALITSVCVPAVAPCPPLKGRGLREMIASREMSSFLGPFPFFKRQPTLLCCHTYSCNPCGEHRL